MPLVIEPDRNVTTACSGMDEVERQACAKLCPMHLVRWFAAALLLPTADVLACGPLAAEVVFIVQAADDPARMKMTPLGRWSNERGTVEAFEKLPGLQPLLEWMPQELYGDCDYKLYDSRGRFVKSVHVNKWSTRPYDEDLYILSG